MDVYEGLMGNIREGSRGFGAICNGRRVLQHVCSGTPDSGAPCEAYGTCIGPTERGSDRFVIGYPVVAWGATEESGSVTRMVVPFPVPSVNGSIRPPEAMTKLAAEWRPSPLPDSFVV